MNNKHYLSSLFILITGLILAIVTFLWLRQSEINHANEQFDFQMKTYVNSIDHMMDHYTQILTALAAHHYSSEFIARKEFHAYTDTILKKHPQIQALKWIPKVLYEEKNRHEQRERAAGISGFSFTQRNQSGEMVPVETRPYYYPIYYMEPKKGNEKAIGFDVGSESVRLKALTEAERSGMVTATTLIKLTQDTDNNKGLALFYPIYDTFDQQKTSKGFYAVALYSEDIITSSIKNILHGCVGINFRLIDIGAAADHQLLYNHKCKSGTAEVPDVHFSQTFPIAGRQWRIDAVANKTFTRKYITFYPWIVLGGMILISLLISILHFFASRRTQILQESNDELRRFQKVAIGREERINELKAENTSFREQLGISNES